MYNNKKIHLIGIGGVSMSGIAYILKEQGAIVTGSDRNSSEITEKLIENGINVLIGNDKKMVDGVDIVVYSAAISDEDGELKEARNKNIVNYERAEFLGILTKNFKNCVCVAGTHGKSTTTGILSHIFIEANLKPTISIGAKLPIIDNTILIGKEDYLLLEACEYVDSFLHFHPTSSIITNIDNDHLNYFKNLDNIKNSFKKFCNLIPENGFLAINNDDENSKVLDETNTNIITYGINNKSKVMAKNIVFNNSSHACFDLFIDDEFIINIELSIPGTHNIYNSLGAIAIAKNYINDYEVIKKAIKSYKGVCRRFEFLGEINGASLYDDYAHHPSEIKTTLDSVLKTKHEKNYAIFQGHTYSRVKKHLNEFAEILAKFDNIIVAPIYAARETNTFDINESDIVSLIKNQNSNVLYFETFKEIENYLRKNLKENDLAVSIGAGDINKVLKNLL